MTTFFQVKVARNGDRGAYDIAVSFIPPEDLQDLSFYHRFRKGILFLSEDEQSGDGWKGPVRQKTRDPWFSGYNVDEPTDLVNKHPAAGCLENGIWKIHVYDGRKYDRRPPSSVPSRTTPSAPRRKGKRRGHTKIRIEGNLIVG